MKALSILALGALLTSSAFAAEIEARFTHIGCKISGNKITRTMKFGKETPVTTSENYTITFTGLDAAVEKAVATSTGRTNSPDDSYVVIEDGKRTEISGTDSKDSLNLIRVIVKACRFSN